MDARYKRLGLSADKGNRLKNHLLDQGVAEQHLIQVGRTRRVILSVTPQAQREHGLERERVETGSFAHEYWKRWYAKKFEEAGFQVELEALRKRSLVDVLAKRGAESVAIEVETGKSDVVWNVRQDLLSKFSRVLVVATDEDALRKVEAHLAHADLVMERVRVVLRENVEEHR